MIYAFKFTASAWLASVVVSHLILTAFGFDVRTDQAVKMYGFTLVIAAVVIFPLVWWGRGR